MAATCNFGLQLIRGKKIVFEAGEVLKLGNCSLCKTKRLNYKKRFSLVRSVDKVNEAVVNGIHHLTEDNENEEYRALVTMLRGRFVEGRFVFRQNFGIRSYEIGPDKTVTIETLMNFLQETAQNHVPSCGISGNDFGATREMSLRNLIWVVTRIQLQIHRYSTWGDEIEVDTWFDAAGKNGMRRDWIIRDHHTKEIIARATSTWVIMNRETRRLSKIPEEVKQEVSPFSFNRLAIANEEKDSGKIHKLSDDIAEIIRSGMAPRWNDMDANQHVNNVKYIEWILESMPKEVLENCSLRSMTLEFRRECTQSNLLESMTSPTAKVMGASNKICINKDSESEMQYTHLLRLQDNKAELVRARTEWHSKL